MVRQAWKAWHEKGDGFLSLPWTLQINVSSNKELLCFNASSILSIYLKKLYQSRLKLQKEPLSIAS